MSLQTSAPEQVKTSGDLESLLGRESVERSDNDPPSSDEAPDENIPDEIDNVFTIKPMEETALPEEYEKCHLWRWLWHRGLTRMKHVRDDDFDAGG